MRSPDQPWLRLEDHQAVARCHRVSWGLCQARPPGNRGQGQQVWGSGAEVTQALPAALGVSASPCRAGQGAPAYSTGLQHHHECSRSADAGHAQTSGAEPCFPRLQLRGHAQCPRSAEAASLADGGTAAIVCTGGPRASASASSSPPPALPSHSRPRPRPRPAGCWPEGVSNLPWAGAGHRHSGLSPSLSSKPPQTPSCSPSVPPLPLGTF